MRDPVDEINELIRVREGWSDAAVLADLVDLEPLPREDVCYAADSALSPYARGDLQPRLGRPRAGVRRVYALGARRRSDVGSRRARHLARACALRARAAKERDGSLLEETAHEIASFGQ